MVRQIDKRPIDKFDEVQVREIIDKVVPLIAAPEDQEFFRGVLWCRALEQTSSADFAHFVSKMVAS